jgi:hypothetical protein
VKRKEDYPLTVTDIMEILGIGKRIALMDRTDFPTVRIGKLKRVNRDGSLVGLIGVKLKDGFLFFS